MKIFSCKQSAEIKHVDLNVVAEASDEVSLGGISGPSYAGAEDARMLTFASRTGTTVEICIPETAWSQIVKLIEHDRGTVRL